MPDLTIFSTPKPFRDPHINMIQRNAIQSWKNLGENVEVFLVGDEEGMAEAAAEFGVGYLPDVARNDLGTPLVSSIFALAREASSSPLLAYVNGDILLLPDFVKTAQQAAHLEPRFLLVGRRWDLDVLEPLEFNESWDTEIAEMLTQNGVLHAPMGSDYFIFPKEVFTEIPDFAIGRAGWDNWMIYHAVQQPWPCIDASSSATVIHQNHDYAHLPGGQPHYRHEETYRNADMGGGMANMYILLDANKELADGVIRAPRQRLARILRKLERFVSPKDDQHTRISIRLKRFFRRLWQALV
jgi:hypothetical protein